MVTEGGRTVIGRVLLASSMSLVVHLTTSPSSSVIAREILSSVASSVNASDLRFISTDVTRSRPRYAGPRGPKSSTQVRCIGINLPFCAYRERDDVTPLSRRIPSSSTQLCGGSPSLSRRASSRGETLSRVACRRTHSRHQSVDSILRSEFSRADVTSVQYG